MANSFNTFTLEIAKQFLEGFESARVLSKNVNTQLLKGRFNPDTGDTFDFKRPTDYLAVETADGDVSGSTASDIITGRASGTVQNYITSFVDFDEADQAIKMGNLDELLAPMSTRVVTRLETNFAKFMVKNVGLLTGTPGTAIDAWSDIAAATAMLKATGVPQDAPWIAAVNSFAQVELADVQRSLGSGGVSGELISEAHQRAIISENFGGMKVMTADTLASHSTFTDADRAGTLTAAPDVTYNTAKNTMTQTLAVTAFGANTVVAAGEVIQITGRNRLNLATRELMLDGTGSAILFTGTVTTAVTLGASGEGNITITGPAIYETAGGAGAYNTVDSSPTTGDVVTLLGAASKTIQPGLFWHKNAFSIGSVPMKRLYSTDTFAETKDGLQLRVSQGAGFLENTNKVRIDLRPAFAALNPFFAGQLHGS
jgi:hypothetical protein